MPEGVANPFIEGVLFELVKSAGLIDALLTAQKLGSSALSSGPLGPDYGPGSLRRIALDYVRRKRKENPVYDQSGSATGGN